jgi:hypothetical protein
MLLHAQALFRTIGMYCCITIACMGLPSLLLLDYASFWGCLCRCSSPQQLDTVQFYTSRIRSAVGTAAHKELSVGCQSPGGLTKLPTMKQTTSHPSDQTMMGAPPPLALSRASQIGFCVQSIAHHVNQTGPHCYAAPHPCTSNTLTGSGTLLPKQLRCLTSPLHTLLTSLPFLSCNCPVPSRTRC